MRAGGWQLKSSVQNFSVSSHRLHTWSYVVISIHNLMHLSFNFKWALCLVHSNFEFYPTLTVSLHNQTWIPLIHICPMLLTNYRTSTFALGKSEVHKQKLKKNQSKDGSSLLVFRLISLLRKSVKLSNFDSKIKYPNSFFSQIDLYHIVVHQE